MSLQYFKNNYVYLCWVVLFIVTNVSLFVSKCITFHRENPKASTCLMLARGAGKGCKTMCKILQKFELGFKVPFHLFDRTMSKF